MAVKSIIYDLDGTLVDSCDWHYVALNTALKEATANEISRDEHQALFEGLTTVQKLKILSAQGRVRDEDIPRISLRKKELMLEASISGTTLDLEKIRMHEFALDAGLSMACVTSCSRDAAEAMLERTGQLRYMRFLVCNEDVINHKPHPEPYIRAMIRLGHEPQEYLIVEDSEIGAMSAGQTGARVWRVGSTKDVTMSNLKSLIDSSK